jgi:demethoxyubiquinone hydroxylase (CLK1/Coq7/Cat5 family)
MENNYNGCPVNTKSLLASIFDQMGKLSRGEITATDACAYAKLASQATNVLNYELKRTVVQLRLDEIGHTAQATLRDIESKVFDNAKALE